MRFIFSIVKNIIAVIAIIIIVFFALKYAPFLKDQEWNPMYENKPSYQSNTTDPQLTRGQRYSVEDNDLLNNVPLGQTKQVFDWLNKKEFMSVSGLGRMGYNDEYLAGQRRDKFIIYKFGEDSIRVYSTEIEMHQDLQRLSQDIEFKPREAYD